MTKKVYLSALPYCLWLFLFVLAPIALLVYKSFFDIHNQLTLANYATYFTSWTYLKMSLNSVIYATIISFVTLVISYPAAYFLTKLKHKQLWLMLIILPTWINLLLKAYAFIGIFGKSGAVNQFLSFFGIGSQQLLFTDFAFIFVASYIEIPFMILPIFNAIDDIDQNLVKAGYDLGATRLQNFTQIIFPLSMNGVRSGVQAVFIPSLRRSGRQRGARVRGAQSLRRRQGRFRRHVRGFRRRSGAAIGHRRCAPARNHRAARTRRRHDDPDQRRHRQGDRAQGHVPLPRGIRARARIHRQGAHRRKTAHHRRKADRERPRGLRTGERPLALDESADRVLALAARSEEHTSE